MSDDLKNSKRPPLRVVSQEVADAAQKSGEELAGALEDFREWKEFRWEDNPSGYMIWARRVRQALVDYSSGNEEMPEPYWFLRGFMSRWRRIHRAHVTRFLERRAHYEHRTGNVSLAQALMLYAKAIHVGRDLKEDGSLLDGLEGSMGLCVGCGSPIPSTALLEFKAPKVGSYLQCLATEYRCARCGWTGPARSIRDPEKGKARRL